MIRLFALIALITASGCVKPQAVHHPFVPRHRETVEEILKGEDERNTRHELYFPIDKRLQCTLSLPANAVQGDPLPLTIEVRNRSETPLRILVHDGSGPLARQNDNKWFHADCDGKLLVDRGYLARRIRRPTQPSEYEKLEPGGAYVVVLPFDKWFDFVPGHCTIYWYKADASISDVIDDPLVDAHPESKDQHGAALDCNHPLTVDITPAPQNKAAPLP